VQDITGGLPRVAELFEPAKPEGSTPSSARIDGVQAKDTRAKRKVLVTPITADGVVMNETSAQLP
jgi:DNA-directed RNA polymerase subunit beta'